MARQPAGWAKFSARPEHLYISGHGPENFGKNVMFLKVPTLRGNFRHILVMSQARFNTRNLVASIWEGTRTHTAKFFDLALLF